MTERVYDYGIVCAGVKYHVSFLTGLCHHALSSEASDQQQETTAESCNLSHAGTAYAIYLIKETQPPSFLNPHSAPHQSNATSRIPTHVLVCVLTARGLLSRTVHAPPHSPPNNASASFARIPPDCGGLVEYLSINTFQPLSEGAGVTHEQAI